MNVRVMEGESNGEQVGGELESVTSAGCFVQGSRNETGS